MRALAWVLLLVPAVAAAQARPSVSAWRRAESVVRAHYTAQQANLLDVTRRREPGMGAAFWVRREGPSGGLVLVRDGAVIEGRGEAVIHRVLESDRFLERGSWWTAGALLRLLRDMGPPLPDLGQDAIDERHPVRVLRPRLERGPDGARLTLFAFRPGPPEDPARRHHYVRRVVLTIDRAYALRWSAVEAITLDLRGRRESP